MISFDRKVYFDSVRGPLFGGQLSQDQVDGQEAILVDNVANPIYQWRFRYNASSTSPFKWELVGGDVVTLLAGRLAEMLGIEVQIAKLDPHATVLGVAGGRLLEVRRAGLVERRGSLLPRRSRARLGRSGRRSKPRRGILLAADGPADQQAEKNAGYAEDE